MPRERALSKFVREQLTLLSACDGVTRHFQILKLEAVRPTAVYRKLVSEEAAPFLGFAVDLTRRFMPEDPEFQPHWWWPRSGWSVSAISSYAIVSNWRCHRSRSILMMPA